MMAISRSGMSQQLKGNRKKSAPKELSPKQQRLAEIAPPKNKITGADFKRLRKRKKKA